MENNSPQQIWDTACAELKGQMTKATFDMWVCPTKALALQNGTLTVAVRSPYAKEWLEKRLYATIQRTVVGILGRAVNVQFEVLSGNSQTTETPPETQPTPQPGDVIVELIEPPLVPFIQVQKYGIWFWQPLIGATAFATWLMLRTLDKENVEWGKRHRISVDLIAQTLGINRQQITGVKRGSSWQPGAFDILTRERLARIEPIGSGRDVIWWARVLNSVPLLTPQQLAKLPALIVERHDHFLKDFAVDAERWQQIELPTLIPEFSCAYAQDPCAYAQDPCAK